MRERAEQLLRIACMILAALVVYQLAGVYVRMNPLHGTKVPELPSLASSTNNPAGGSRATNRTAMTTSPRGTNVTNHSTGTNAASSVVAAGTNTTSVRSVVNATQEMDVTGGDIIVEVVVEKAETNVAARLETNISPSTAYIDTGTNEVTSKGLTMAGTNLLGTNISNLARTLGTNATPRPNPGMNNASAVPSSSQLEMASMSIRSSTMPGKPADLPPAIQARISKITDSEILGPVIRPQPMALMGIAGDFAFLRAPSGQTGMVKPGDSLGEIKLLKIGINRVLVEQDGQEKELTIFSGYGSDSLLNKPTETSNETNNKKP